MFYARTELYHRDLNNLIETFRIELFENESFEMKLEPSSRNQMLINDTLFQHNNGLEVRQHYAYKCESFAFVSLSLE